jgi:hypothetical protein
LLEFTEELDPAEVPELLDVTEELLLASVDELDLALDDDFAELLEELSPLEESDSLEGRSPTESGKTDESSSPQATNKKANASVKKRRIGLDVIPRAMRGGSILLYTSS